MSDWGSFVDEGSPLPIPAKPDRAPDPVVDSGWGAFADGTEAPPGTSPVPPPSTGPPVPPRGVPVPSPEAVASLLSEGENLWAYVDGDGTAYLGSGCALTVVKEGLDGAGPVGWRPVVVVDPATLTVRPVPLVLAEPPAGTGTSVSELYRDPEPYERPAPGRAGPFPAGQGPDLDALLAAAVAEERDRVTARADEAARLAQNYAESQIRAAQEAAQRSVQAAQQSVWQWQQRAQTAEAEVVRLDTELQRSGWRRWRSGGGSR